MTPNGKHTGVREASWWHPQLGNGILKHVPVAMSTHTTGEKLLEAVSSNLAASKVRSSCMIPTVMRQKHMVKSPVGPGTKNPCTGQGQQQLLVLYLNWTKLGGSHWRTVEDRSHSAWNNQERIPVTGGHYQAMNAWRQRIGKTWKML